MGKSKGQAATEFLMSYGWIILVVFIVIGVLTYFGVLRPGEQLPESCILEVGLACEDFKATSEGVTLMVRNSLGKDIKVETIAIPKKNCLGVFNIDLPNGQRKRFDISCDLSDLESLKADFEFAFITPGGFKHTKRGSLVTLILKRKTGGGKEGEEGQACSDGTPYGGCSTTKPKYCKNGSLISKCIVCGCDSGECQENGSCLLICTDGTGYSQCSTTKPLYCYNGSLINKCSVCGCSSGKECEEDGSCVVKEEVSGTIVWTKYEGNPVLTYGPAAWDAARSFYPAIIKEGGTYRMWYTGTYLKNGVIGIDNIGYATSSDGISWTKYEGNPILQEDTAWESSYLRKINVIKDDSTYRMWYTAGDDNQRRIGYATSSDGVRWTKYENNPVLGLGAAGSWDAAMVEAPSVIKDDNLYRMWYSGSKLDQQNAQVGYACGCPEGQDCSGCFKESE